jgi:hypothetical protein
VGRVFTDQLMPGLYSNCTLHFTLNESDLTFICIYPDNKRG